MANRNTLAVSQLENFKEYLINNGWEIQEPKGHYEVLKATKKGRKFPLIVWQRHDTNSGKDLVHLTVADRDISIVRKFLNKRRTNK